MSAPDLQRRRIGTFFDVAIEEMKAAETLLQTLPRQSAFFQQQAAGKLLRAVLEVEGISAGPTHNLRTLSDLLPGGQVMGAEFIAVEELSSAATRFGYPGGYGDAPTVDPELLKQRQVRPAALRTAVEDFVAWASKEMPK